MGIRRINFLLTPILMCAYPILSFYQTNISILSLKFLQAPLFYSVLAALILIFITNLIIRNRYKSSLIVTFLAFIFFSYGHVSRFLDDKLFISLTDSLVLGPDKILLPLTFLLTVSAVFFILRSVNNPDHAVSFTSTILLLLVTYILIPITGTELAKTRITGPNPIIRSGSTGTVLSNAPDIYYIILDGYARQDILKDIYDYDNSDFINSLRQMGFFVADKSHSNYIHTYLSLPSTLNMRYLDDLPATYGKKPVDDSAAINLVHRNLLSSKLKDYGYKTLNFQTWWSGTNENYPADISYQYSRNYQIIGLNLTTSETNMVFLQTTLLNPVIKEVWNNVLRGKILQVFEKLPDVPYLDGSKFTLAHITIPHPPYIFTRDGNPTPDADSQSGDEGMEKRGDYLNQLTFASDRILPVLKKIITNSRQTPIIVLQSDHGPASIFGRREDWKNNYSQAGIAERTGILYAVFLPDGDYRQFYDTITPVNTFRIILDQYFGEDHELLPDQTYYTSYEAMYDFDDVTTSLP